MDRGRGGRGKGEEGQRRRAGHVGVFFFLVYDVVRSWCLVLSCGEGSKPHGRVSEWKVYGQEDNEATLGDPRLALVVNNIYEVSGLQCIFVRSLAVEGVFRGVFARVSRGVPWSFGAWFAVRKSFVRCFSFPGEQL